MLQSKSEFIRKVYCSNDQPRNEVTSLNTGLREFASAIKPSDSDLKEQSRLAQMVCCFVII